MKDPFYGVVAPLIHDILEAALRCELQRPDDDGEEQGFKHYDPEAGCRRQLEHAGLGDDSDDDDDDRDDEDAVLRREITLCLDTLSRDISRVRERSDKLPVSVDEWHVVAEASAVLLEILQGDNMERLAHTLEVEFGKDGDELIALATQILFLDCVKSASIVVCLALEVESCKEAALRCETAVVHLDTMLSVNPPAFSKRELRAHIALLQETIQSWKAVRELAVHAIRHEPFYLRIADAYSSEINGLMEGAEEEDLEIPLSLAAAEAGTVEAVCDECDFEDGQEALEELAGHLGFFRRIFLMSHRCPE